jgi:phosphoglycerate-specific signal transduction histidine kinase
MSILKILKKFRKTTQKQKRRQTINKIIDHFRSIKKRQNKGCDQVLPKYIQDREKILEMIDDYTSGRLNHKEKLKYLIDYYNRNYGPASLGSKQTAATVHKKYKVFKQQYILPKLF